MVNLLNFRAHAACEPPRPESRENINGAEAHQRYGAVAQNYVAEGSGSIVWEGPKALVFIGGGERDWNQVVCVRHPSRQVFLQMVSQPNYLAATVHRTAGLERTALLCCAAGTAA
jgi:uncharacterized protein (DUF1330 family)